MHTRNSQIKTTQPSRQSEETKPETTGSLFSWQTHRTALSNKRRFYYIYIKINHKKNIIKGKEKWKSTKIYRLVVGLRSSISLILGHWIGNYIIMVWNGMMRMMVWRCDGSNGMMWWLINYDDKRDQNKTGKEKERTLNSTLLLAIPIPGGTWLRTMAAIK